MKKGLLAVILFFMLLLAAYTAAQMPVLRVTCNDAGAIRITGWSGGEETVTAKIGGSTVEVPGNWRKGEEKEKRFNSEEAVFLSINKTSYSIKIGSTSRTVQCPGFKFSCRIINVSPVACYKRNNTLIAKYNAHNLKISKNLSLRFEKPFMLTYKAFEGRKEHVHSPQITSPDFENIAFGLVRHKELNKYRLVWNTSINITRLAFQYKDCSDEKYNFYKSVECNTNVYCDSDKECLDNEECFENSCERIECGACEYIESHKCMSYECCSNEECPESSYCSSNKCAGLSCAPDEIIANHECSKLSCTEDEQIIDGKCVKLNCAEDEEAVNGKCIKLNCGDDEYLENHECKELICSEGEEIKEHNCIKLKCGFLRKAENHQCVSLFVSLFSIFKKK